MTALGTEWETITPNDSVDLDRVYKYIVIGATGGPVVCRDKNGTDATFQVNAGDILKCRPQRILSSGTTATPIIGVIR
jgi:hypothetical protein